LTNLNVKIPLPEKLRTVEKALRKLKQDKLADDFVATMNHAAEQAVPEAAAEFVQAMKQMTIEEAEGILTGPKDAATQYFRKATATNLFERFLPIVKKATDKTGVTASYKTIHGKSQRGVDIGHFAPGRNRGRGRLRDEQAMDGLFKMVAEEEKRIRENPVARTSELLEKVFGALRK
jgi:hypothetical protein